MATSATKTIGSRDVIQLQQARANIVAFLIVLAGLGSIFYVLLARQGSLSSAGGAVTLGLMWCPALAAGLASRFRHIPGPRIRNIWTTGLPCSRICHTRPILPDRLWDHAAIRGIAPFQNTLDPALFASIVPRHLLI